MKELTIRQIAEGAKGEIKRGHEDDVVKKIVIDSRTAKQGDLFVAIIGENQDGHNYVRQAAEAGCRAFLLSDEKAAEELSDAFREASVIRVKNTTKGLQELSRYYLNRFNVKKLAVTGSTGKTTTKEMLYAVLSAKYRTVRNPGNYNNEIGMPLTAFMVEDDTEAVIFEMGMSSLGEINVLADIVRPELSIITNVGTSHIEYLKTRENILKAKMEITDFMTEDDVLIVNSDNDFLTTKSISACMQEKYRENYKYGGNFDIITAGENGKADCVLSHRADRGEDGISFRLSFQGESEEFQLPLLGAHNAFNAMLAVAAGMKCGISMDQAAKRLAGMEPESRRLAVEEKNGVKLIDDTYNASPDSMMAAIDALMSIEGRRKVAILADILEMGDVAEEYHRSVGEYASQKKADVVISIGPNAKFIAEGARSATRGGVGRIIWHETKEPLLDAISQIIKPGDVVLVKGSNGMKMTEVADAIRSL